MEQRLPESLREQLFTRLEGENRVVTAMFADMTNSVEVTSELHPEEAAELVNRLLRSMVDILMKYGGRVDRFLGDGLLAVFGTPQAHENDPERAILAALEIRESAKGLGIETTAGVNTGEAYVGGVGSEQHQEFTVIGPVVNLASRLQAAAESGQILVGESTYRHTLRAFEFEPLSLSIKGMSNPIRTYRVQRPRTRPEKVRGIEGLRAELVGREEEFAKLQSTLTEVLDCRGQMASLIGEAGVGKSRLIAELRERVLELESSVGRGQPRWLEGRCLELGVTASYWPFVDMFREHFGFRSEDTNSQRAERITTSLNALVDENLLSAERAKEMAPLLGRLLSVSFEDQEAVHFAGDDPERVKQQTFMALRDVILALAQQRPLILVFEDLHWSDELSIDLIGMLMESLTLAPLFLICVYRPEQEHKCWHLSTIASRKCPARYTELRLHELKPRESRRLIESLLDIDQLPDSTKDLILEKSSGNPFFVEEVVRSLIDAGMVYREGETWRAREGIEAVSVPESIQSVVLSRVDRLEEELRHVLQSASVIGHLFRRRLLEQVTEQEQTLEQDLWTLEDHDFIYQERIVPEEEYSFKHVLTQETIYGNILRKRRTAFHQLVATAMESLYRDDLEAYYEQLAYHYDRSGYIEKAIEYLLKAGEKARQAYLNDDAINYFERALQRMDESQTEGSKERWRLDAIKGLGKIHHDLGQETEAAMHLQDAVELGRELEISSRDLVLLYHWLGDALFWQGRYDEVIELGEAGLELLGDDTESVEAALMHSRLCVAHSQKGNESKAREYNERNAKFLERLPYSEELIPAYRNVAQHYGYYLHDPEKALSWLKTYRVRAEEHGDLRGTADARRETGAVLESIGDLRKAVVEYEAALELFRRINDLRYSGWCLGSLGRVHVKLGDLYKAETYAQEGSEAAEQGGIQIGRANSAFAKGAIALCRGQHETAVEAFQRSVKLYREIGNALEEMALWHLALAQEGAGDQTAAVKTYEAVVEFASSSGGRDVSSVALVVGLHGLERSRSSQEFRSFCDDLQKRYPDLGAPNLERLYLTPTRPSEFFAEQVHDRFDHELASDWTWEDPFGDGSYSIDDGLTIRAGSGRLLVHPTNQSAPRLVRTVHGEFAAEVICTPASDELTSLGGFFLRQGAECLILAWGFGGDGDVTFWTKANIEGAHLIGRGLLRPAREAHLRLERIDQTVRALCRSEGEWHAICSFTLPADSSTEIGLFAEGLDAFHRAIHPGMHPEGTAIRFESFRLWGSPP